MHCRDAVDCPAVCQRDDTHKSRVFNDGPEIVRSVNGEAPVDGPVPEREGLCAVDEDGDVPPCPVGLPDAESTFPSGGVTMVIQRFPWAVADGIARDNEIEIGGRSQKARVAPVNVGDVDGIGTCGDLDRPPPYVLAQTDPLHPQRQR